MNKQISVAVLGCGRSGNGLMRTLEKMPEIKRIVGYDISEAALSEIKKKHPVTETTQSLDEVLCDEDIRLVFVETLNESHAPLAVKAMQAGKAVMCEKPSGVNDEQIDELIRVQRQTGAFLQVGLELRYSKAYVEAKKVIASGEIGTPVNVHFTYSMPPFGETMTEADGRIVPNWHYKSGVAGGMCLEKLCHYIDLVRWWNEGARVDKYVATSADKVIPYFEVEDNVHISYHLDNGCTSQLYFVMTAAPGSNNDLLGHEDLFDQDKQGHKLNYVITGTEGAIEIDIFQRQLRVYHHPGKKGQKGENIVRTMDWTKEGDEGYDYGEQRYFHNTHEQYTDVVKRVINGEPPSIDIEDAQETMRLCLEFEEASKNRRWEVIER